jgi:glycosyltransferase involved in cell wall biosynthesis
VTCDNRHGAAFARQFNPRAFVVPDPPQVEMFDKCRTESQERRGELVIGWIGSPSTLCNLYRIWEPLEQLFAKYPGLHLRLVGTGHDRWLLPRFEKVRWSATPHYTRSEMVREVLGMDIGLYPLFDVEDSLARGILKATVYMSGGVAVVASAVGQSRELICDGVNGMLAVTPGDWFAKLEQLILDRGLRRAIADRGLATVRREYSLARCFESLADALSATQFGIVAGEQ